MINTHNEVVRRSPRSRSRKPALTRSRGVRVAPATRHMTISFHFISYYIHKQRSLSIYTLALPVLSLQNSFEYEKLS
ncbi:hypothetical protein RSOLAG1IB_07229 [Rhizoctonia solani AG-1 IB]|uniref:Uncharacterized protein n=1 Tax=Thanatephorus cucumeris (strain AG1-IB / isolate 7/3/14) TaxID=1108050 RepID=A0A0B7FAX9_THACB|nr:hypothetical protein RSOLAG1IB_07229 [Rhizoctonia solani AG-1 IB]